MGKASLTNPASVGSRLLEFVQQSLHRTRQRRQGVLHHVPHRAHLHRGIAVNEVVAKRNNLRHIWNAAGQRRIKLGQLVERFANDLKLGSTAARAIALAAYAAASMPAQ